MTRSGFPSTAVPSEAYPTDWRNEALPPKPKVVYGDDLLYRLLLDLFGDDDAAYGHVPQLMLVSMGVWLPLDACAQFPVLLPWVVRDPTCRAGTGRSGQWGAPNPQGSSATTTRWSRLSRVHWLSGRPASRTSMVDGWPPSSSRPTCGAPVRMLGTC